MKFKTLDFDRSSYLDGKFHRLDEPFNPYNRMGYNGYDYDPSTGLSTDEIKSGLKGIAERYKNAAHPVAKARAVEYILQNTRIDINAHDYFFGLYTWNREIRDTTINVWSKEVFDGKIPDINARMNRLNDTMSGTIWPDFDHVVPDWDSLMRLGLPGIRQRARDKRAARETQMPLTARETAYFDGIEIEYTAFIDFLKRLEARARQETHEKAPVVAASLARLVQGPPQTFLDALQLIYSYFMVSESVDHYQVRSLGNGLDHTLYPFYQADLANGISTREEMAEYLGYFFMQWSAIGNYWGQPFYLAGTNADGSTLVNEMSHLILDVYDALEIYNPKIQIKVNTSTPPEFLFKIFDMIRRGHSSFVFCCEPGMIKAVMNYGATYDEARTMDIRGCYETGVRANEVSTSTGYINAAKPVEYVFSDGFDAKAGIQGGLHTGALESLISFDDFLDAVMKQWSHLITEVIDCSRAYDPYLETLNPSSLYSATIESSLDNARDGYQDGVKFNNSAILNCGFATMIDSLMAVKKLVYEENIVSLHELKCALDADWKGYEPLRAKALALPQKYGNGNDETDDLGARLSNWFCNQVNNKPNGRGGVYKAILHSAMMFVWQGKATGATPDGRHAGDHNSKNASPTDGMDKNGVTTLIRSALKLTPSNYLESFCLDLMLHPSIVQGEAGLNAMKAILDTYMQGGGMSLQFNIFNLDTLKDAQAHPEKYRTLQVRICGWNALWVNLSADEQNAYIKRCANA